MTKTFNIFGDIVDTDGQKMSQEDVCPNDFKLFVETVEANDEVEIHINSCGGSVTGGISIANMISQLSKTNKTIAKVDGIAASIASVIACACDELHMGKSSFLMIHQVWGNVSGNCDELRKEADVMEMMTKSLLSFYHRKFDLSDEQLLEYLKNESWISGQDVANFNLNAIVDCDCEEYKYAAKLIDKISAKFNNKTIIESLKNMEEKEIKEVETTELSAMPSEIEKEVIEQIVEEKKEDNPETEEVKEEVKEEKPSYEELEKKIEELTKQLNECQKKLAECTDEDVEKRVAKCQSTFQNKINNFKNELKVKDEELQKFKDSVSSLQSELEESKKELHDMSAAFEEKNNALAKLNAGVLSNPIENKTDWRNLKGKDFINWVESHKDEIKNNKIN